LVNPRTRKSSASNAAMRPSSPLMAAVRNWLASSIPRVKEALSDGFSETDASSITRSLVGCNGLDAGTAYAPGLRTLRRWRPRRSVG